MADANKHLPPDWHDDDRMNFMFSAFPEHRHVNPKHWDSKLQFWRKLILENCDHNHELCVDFETLRRRFTRNGLVPLGFQTVLEEMLKTGELQTLESFTKGLNNTWLSWGFDIAKKSLSWTVGNLWGNDTKGKFDGTELFIITDVLKNKSESLLKMHRESVEYEATDHIVPWNVLKARCNKGGLKLAERDLDLVVCYLQKERKVTVHVTNEGEKVIKFVGKNETAVSTVSEKDIGILRIKKTMASLTLEINKLEKTSESCKQKAKEFSSKGLKKSALTVLKKKASVQKTLDKTHGSLHTLEELLHRIQQANTDKMIIDTLKSGSNALKAIQEELSAKDVDNVMLDLEQTLDDAEDIQQAIAQGNQAISNRNEDENHLEALEKELAALSFKSDGNTLSTEANAEKISTAKEAASVPTVPGGGAWKLPEPPSHSPSKSDQPFEEERRCYAIEFRINILFIILFIILLLLLIFTSIFMG